MPQRPNNGKGALKTLFDGERVIALASAGKTAPEIVAMLGVSRKSVATCLREWRTRRSNSDPTVRERWASLIGPMKERLRAEIADER